MKSIFKMNNVFASLALAGMVGVSGPVFANTDYADTMPSIEGKKLLVGYWHNWIRVFPAIMSRATR